MHDLPGDQLDPDSTDDQASDRPSMTHPTCKVCKHPRRRGIEVALLEGQSREVVARRFSTAQMTLNRQNLHAHYHNHMQVIDRVVVEQVRARARNAMLDVETAGAIRERQNAMRGLIVERATQALEEGRVRWSARDILQVQADDALLEDGRSKAQFNEVLLELRLFMDAVKGHVDDDVRERIFNDWEQMRDDAKLGDCDVVDDFPASGDEPEALP